MKKKVLGITAFVLLLGLLGLSVLLNFALVVLAPFRGLASETGRTNIREETLFDGDPSAKIAHIDLEGMITNFEGGLFGDGVSRVKAMLEAAATDPAVKAIVLRVNSPGGEITASDILYQSVRRTVSEKPVVVYLDSVGASGGYYVACGGSYIMANETTLTGSIGVSIQTLNYEELLGKIGLDSVVFTSGESKDMLSPSREMRPEEREYVQQMVNEMYERFLGIVGEARNIPTADLRDGIADGRVLTGRSALEAGLVDQTGYVEEAYAKARELAQVPNARIVRYGPAVGLGNLIGFLGESTARGRSEKSVRLELGERYFPRLQPGAVYLLPAHFAR